MRPRACIITQSNHNICWYSLLDRPNNLLRSSLSRQYTFCSPLSLWAAEQAARACSAAGATGRAVRLAAGFAPAKAPAVPPQLCRCCGHVTTHQRCRVFRPVAAAMLPYPETCTVLLPMDATAFYHVSHSAAFCSFVAEVRGRCSALARRHLLLVT